MNCNTYTIRVVEGNEFSLLFPLKYRTYVDEVATDTDIDCTLLEDCVVTIGDTEYDVSLGTDGVLVVVPATLERGTYDIELTATYESSAIRVAIHNGLQIVQYSGQSDAEQYIAGSPIVADAAFVIGGTFTDEELEELKEEYADAIEALDAAKEEYEAKVEALDDVATETNATANKEEILEAIDGITIPTDYAKQGDNEDATLSDTQAAAEAAQAAAEAISGYALQGDDTTATNTALLTILNTISTNMYKGVVVVSQTTDATIAPNVWNVWGEVDSLTITKGTDLDNVVNEYMIRFTATDSTAITFSGWTLTWYGGSEPTWTEGATYEISIIDDLALWAEFE